MAKSWISFPERFKLQDVQAVINIIISLLSALSIFVLGRVCWQASSTKIARRKDIALSSLLTIGSLGEALDVLFLLKFHFFSFTWIVAQCVIVACLTATAILSGPIARYATQRGRIVAEKDVNGLLALAYHNSIASAMVEWNLTHTSLDRAGFPENQLLDFLPDTSTPWNYKSEEWNSTWSMDCTYHGPIQISLETTGDCDYLYAEVPGLENVIPNSPDTTTWYSTGGFYVNRTSWKDVLMFLYEPVYHDYNNDTFLTHNMSITIAAVHLHNLAKSSNNSCNFGVGEVEQASYTKAQCNLFRNYGENTYISFPDSGDAGTVPESYRTYYGQNFKQQSMSNDPIRTIIPQELVRFYQVYMITKDTQSHQPVTRSMSVEVTVVQVSAVFLAVCIFVTLLIIVGIGRYVLFKIIHPELQPPQSKLDWLLQTIKNPGCEGVILSGGEGASDRFQWARYGFRDVLGEERSPREKVSGFSI
jgi:hypothetical protein